MYLTDRDEELMETLVFKVNVLSFQQIFSIWWGKESKTAKKTAKKRLAQLCRAKYIILHQIVARPVVKIESPLFCWSPGQEFPDYEKLSDYLNNRWNDIPSITSIYTASKKTIHLLGGIDRRFKKISASHELNVSEIYLNEIYLKKQKSENNDFRWIHHEYIPHWKDNIKFDALIKYKHDESDIIIKFGGKLNSEKLQLLHEYFVINKRSYQLW